MTKAEILAQLPQLSSEDRNEILMRLWHMEEEAAGRRGPTAAEQEILDRELAQYEVDRNPGSSWTDVEARLRRRR
jgi:putative addiction module component (TIGR02574 family)